MKKLLLICMIFLINISYAQKTKQTIQITETERIIDKYGSEVINKFNSLIDNATPMAEQGFEMIVRLQIAKGITLLLPALFCLIFIIMFSAEYKTVQKKIEEDDNTYNYGPFSEEYINIFLIFYIFAAIILFITALFTLHDALLHLMAPEWYAIKEILNLF